MTKRLPLLFILGISFLVALLHFAGSYLYLYWRIPGYDRIVHLIGGFLVTFISLTIIYFKRMPQVRTSHIILVGLFASVVIGVGWELFELQAGITAFGQPGFIKNNAGDIVCDVLGGAAAIYHFIRAYSLRQQ